MGVSGLLSSVGIIGGADGPTAIVVSGEPVFGAVPVLVIIVGAAVVGLLIRQFRKKHRR